MEGDGPFALQNGGWDRSGLGELRGENGEVIPLHLLLLLLLHFHPHVKRRRALAPTPTTSTPPKL